MSSEREWSQLLGEAEQAFRDGNAGRALELATQVSDAAKKERENHALGSDARRRCTLTMATANVALQQFGK